MYWFTPKGMSLSISLLGYFVGCVSLRLRVQCPQSFIVLWGSQVNISCTFEGEVLAAYWKRGTNPEENTDPVVSFAFGTKSGTGLERYEYDITERGEMIIYNVTEDTAGSYVFVIVNTRQADGRGNTSVVITNPTIEDPTTEDPTTKDPTTKYTTTTTASLPDKPLPMVVNATPFYILLIFFIIAGTLMIPVLFKYRHRHGYSCNSYHKKRTTKNAYSPELHHSPLHDCMMQN